MPWRNLPLLFAFLDEGKSSRKTASIAIGREDFSSRAAHLVFAAATLHIATVVNNERR
jgi:hypothetical protein